MSYSICLISPLGTYSIEYFHVCIERRTKVLTAGLLVIVISISNLNFHQLLNKYVWVYSHNQILSGAIKTIESECKCDWALSVFLYRSQK